LGLASDAAFRTRAGATRIGRLNRAVTPTGTTNHTYNKANQIADSGYVYDANGSLTSDGTHTYTYDALKRLTGVSGGGSNETYTLDGAGNRLAEAVNGQTTTFDLDLRGLATVLAAGGRKYLDGAPNFGYDENGNWTSSLTDQAGSVLRSVAPDGTVSAAVRYDPFGGLRPGSATPSGFGYTGEWTDRSGLVNLRARAYDPTLGRFVSADSWGGTTTAPLSANAYAYGLDNPLAYTDPSGHIGKALNFVLSNPGLLIMMIPGIGEAYALGCAITGQDLITGQQLSTGERFLYALGAAGLVGRLGGELAGVGGRFLAAAGRSLGEGMRAFSSGERMATELAGAERAFGEGMRAMGAGERELGAEERGLAGVEKGATEVDRGVTEAQRAEGPVSYVRPSEFRSGVRDTVWENAREPTTGQVRDPLTGRFMSKNEPWDMGHRPGFELPKHQASAAERGIPRSQFLNEHNDPTHYRPELPMSNQGHRGEAPSGVNFYP
jgi:RHS repeat-associated protein